MGRAILPLFVLLLASCGPGEQPADNPDVNAIQNRLGATTAEQQVALGMAERQLLDADLLDARGQEIGDVEGIVRDSSGTVTQLLVEVEDSSPDRYVHVPVNGLRPVQNGNDMDIGSNLTRDQLMQMPEVRR